VFGCLTMLYSLLMLQEVREYSGRKITASLGKITVRGEKRWKGQGGSTTAKSLSEHVQYN
jgi:hypothetical protein